MKRLTMILLVVTVLLPSTALGQGWAQDYPQLSLFPLFGYPLSFYPEGNLVFVPELLGRWQVCDEGGECAFFLFETEDNQAYTFTLTLTGDCEGEREGEICELSSLYEMHLVRLGDYLFADIEPHREFWHRFTYYCIFCSGVEPNQGEVYQPIVGAHVFARLQVEDDKLRFSTLHELRWDCDASQPEQAKPEVACTETDGFGTLLTARMEELQAFVLRHAEDLFPFSDDAFLHRIATEP